MSEFPQENIITVDDDVFYSSYLTESLCVEVKKNPGTIIGNQVKKIAVKDGKIKKYAYWETCSDRKNADKTANIPIGVGGVYYPVRSLRKEVLEKEVFMKCAPQADDLWLGILAMLSSTQVRPTGKTKLEQIPLIVFSNETLFSTNISSGNDAQLNDILNWAQKKIGRNLKKEIIGRNS